MAPVLALIIKCLPCPLLLASSLLLPLKGTPAFIDLFPSSKCGSGPCPPYAGKVGAKGRVGLVCVMIPACSSPPVPLPPPLPSTPSLHPTPPPLPFYSFPLLLTWCPLLLTWCSPLSLPFFPPDSNLTPPKSRIPPSLPLSPSIWIGSPSWRVPAEKQECAERGESRVDGRIQQLVDRVLGRVGCAKK